MSDSERRREWLSGFTGSLGVAVVTTTGAATLWTDGRYHEQADVQLDCGWLLARHGEIGVPTPAAWLSRHLAPGAYVGADPHTVAHSDWQALAHDLGTSPATSTPSPCEVCIAFAPHQRA